MKELKAKARFLKPIVQIGKNGLTEPILKEIKLHLKNRKLIKVKLLKSYISDRDRKELAENLAMMAGAKLVQVIGFVVVLHK